jgi:hypothetical protein
LPCSLGSAALAELLVSFRQVLQALEGRRAASPRPREGHRPAKQPIWSVLLLLGCEREGGPRELRELTMPLSRSCSFPFAKFYKRSRGGAQLLHISACVRPHFSRHSLASKATAEGRQDGAQGRAIDQPSSRSGQSCFLSPSSTSARGEARSFSTFRLAFGPTSPHLRLGSEQGNSRRPAGWRPREGHRPAKQPIWSVLLLLGCDSWAVRYSSIATSCTSSCRISRVNIAA